MGLNERKNPKREKLKKDFETSLKFAKGVIRKIDTFMKSNDWGVVDGFVTNKRTGLASLVKDMEKSMNQIIKLPVDESVNERRINPPTVYDAIAKAGVGTKITFHPAAGGGTYTVKKVGVNLLHGFHPGSRQQTRYTKPSIEKHIKQKGIIKTIKKGSKVIYKESVNEAFVNNLKQAMSYINTDTKDGKEFMKLMKQKSYTKQQGIRAMTLAMRGSAIHGAGPGGVSQFTMHIAKNVKGLK